MSVVLNDIGRPIGRVYDVADVLLYGVRGDGVTDDSAALNALSDDFLSGLTSTTNSTNRPVKLVFPPNLTYLIGSTVNLDLPMGSVVVAYGAKFLCAHNGVAFDLNPDATAAAPINDTADTFTKRRIHWHGGEFYNTNATKTASICFQTYYMRGMYFSDVYVQDFYCGFKFSGKDTYHWQDCFTRDCIRHYWVPAAGTTHTATLTANDLLDLEWRGCHCSFDTDNEAGIYMENRSNGVHVRGGSFNGVPTVAHVRLSDNASLYCHQILFDGVHFEQGGAATPSVLFVSSGSASTNGFYDIAFDGGTDFSSGTVGWYGVTLNTCRCVRFGNVLFNDGSGGSTEQGIYVDDDSRQIRIAEQTVFLNFAAGQAIVLETATNRQHITIEPELVRSATPDMLTGYTAGNFSTTADTLIDMSSAWADWANFLLPPKGYQMVLNVRDSGSAGATTNTITARVRKPSSNTPTGLTVRVAGLPNDFEQVIAGYVGADENGDVTFNCAATGADTMEVTIAVTAAHQ